MIPKIIHQTWKTDEIPKKWVYFSKKVQKLNPDWEYKLWTDHDIDVFVKEKFSDFYDTFQGFSKQIMKVDVIRYLIMYKIGGVYLDLDYEVLQPFTFDEYQVVLPQNRSITYGDKENQIGNCFFASEPNHVFWKDVISDLKNNPPVVDNYDQVVEATGPLLLTRIFYQNSYDSIYTPERMVYHPESPNNKKDIKKIKENGISLGIHHPWGSWKERFSITYLKNKWKKTV